MFEQTGHDQGELDGHDDAMAGKAKLPRLDLMLSLVSDGYRKSYLEAYARAYATAKWSKTQEKIRQSKQSQTISRSTFEADTGSKDSFDKGWEDGFTGKSFKKVKITHLAEKTSYQQGYRLGARDRDFERAKKLKEDHLKRQRYQKQMAEYHRADEEREI